MNPDTIQDNVNINFSKWFYTNNTSYKAIVCITCDRFISPGSEKFLTLDKLAKNQTLFFPLNEFKLDPDLVSCYRISMPHLTIDTNIPENLELDKCLLSPRSFYVNSDNQEDNGFIICEVCLKCISNKKRPKYCIANNFCFGSPPQCILELTDIERIVLSPVKTHAYHFCYTGGQKHKMVGSLLHYKINPMSILQSIAYLSAAEANIVVIIYGQLTKEQYKTVSQKNQIRIPMMIKAIQWLLVHNTEWKALHISEDELTELIRNLNQLTIPTIDRASEIVNGDDIALESVEILDVYFPDKTINIKNGGQESIEELQRLVQESKMNNNDLFCKLTTIKECVQDYKDKNLVNMCLLQYPYGRGGIDETRFTAKGDSTTNLINVQEYIEYINLISQKHFHEGLFQLIQFNMIRKVGMVKYARLQVRNKLDASMIATKLRKEDVEEAMNKKQIATGVYTEEAQRGSQLLKAIDAICHAAPHSNQAARKAKSQAQTIVHHFGTPTFFLTVTPDDDNHFMIQILSGEFIDNDNTPVNELDDIELSSRATKRSQLRLKYPGLCALFFEYALHTVIFEVLGWNLKTNKQEHVGLFGKIDAFTCTIEEQGRSTLHAHFLIWIPRLNKLRDDLHNEETQSWSELLIAHAIDKVSCSKCFFNDDELITQQNNGRRPTKRFIHECTKPTQYRMPSFPDDETLLKLRSYKGNHEELIFCNQEGCFKVWSYNSAGTSYIKDYIQLPLFSSYDTEPRVKRLKALAIEYQKDDLQNKIPNFVIDFGYNFHFHTSSCVKTSKNDTLKYVGVKLQNACRYNYPQKNREKTILLNVTTEPIPWVNWNGTFELRHIKEVLVKREQCDAFQNICCPPISKSKLTCNTNIRFVTTGQNAEYCFNYSMKPTNKEDALPYDKVRNSMGKILSEIKYEDSDSSEAVRRLLSLSHNHQSDDVIRPTLAAYLTRNKSRFIFSHKFVWCPLRDLKSLTNGEEIKVSIQFNNKTPFYKCVALNYLCRPNSLSQLCAMEFFSLYEVTTFSEYKAIHQGAERLIKTEFFQHPSYDSTTGCCKQCVIKRQEVYLVQVMQYDFIDSVVFHGNILDNDFPISEEVEQYCHNVVILFMPFRCSNDLMIEGKYTNCVRNGIEQNTIYPKHKLFLQYLLDSKSNNLRFKIQMDDLERSAEHFHSPLQETNDSNDVNDSILHYESNDIINNEQSIDLVDYLLSETDATNTNINIPADNMLKYEFKGYDCLPDVTSQNEDDALYSNAATFLETIDDTNNNDNVGNNNQHTLNKIELYKKDLMTIFIHNNHNCNLNLKQIIGADVDIMLKEANGTAQSIISWATNCPLDTSQKRAFEVITGYYILSYINSIPNLQEGDRIDTVLLEEKHRLELLVGYSKIKSHQLICFLHGPAGSGKSTIIALLQSYSQKYHELLSFQSYNRSIVVTAMTGVAATIIGGETVHSALHLKKNIDNIPPEAIDLWFNTKLLIIDEISFANNKEIEKISENLGHLKVSYYVPFGGINVIFCGDLRQLEPVTGSALYKNHENLSSTFKIHVNCYIELTGSHRFAADPEWGQLLLKFRNGEPEDSDIDLINTKVVQIPTDDKIQLTLPSDIKYATYANVDRDCINTAIFHKKIQFSKDNYHHTNNFIMIFCDNIKIKKNVKDEFVELTQPAKFYKQCTESNLKGDRSGRMDPVLKLYIGCEVMITENIDVPNGLANGTRAKIDKILLKQGFQYMTVAIGDNLFVKGIYASQIESLSLIHIMQNVQQRTFKIKPKTTTFKANIPIPNSAMLNHLQEIKDEIIVRFTQFPIIINVATTGHKLQGTGVDKLFVHTWRYDKNWPYVVLSRVKTFDGLYLRSALRKNDKANYKLHPDYISFIAYFTLLSPLPVDYDAITNNTN